MDTHADMPARHRAVAAARYELRFHSLFHEGRGYTFPCDAAGDVDLGALNERARHSLARALAAVGRELSAPRVQPSGVRMH
jgi:hypothetical protein